MIPCSFSEQTLKTPIDGILIEDILNGIYFKTQIPDAIQICLSPYETFFDGLNFYYDEEYLRSFNQHEQCQIIMNEIFNFYHGYYMRNAKQMHDKIINTNLILLYHVGLTYAKITYAQDIRHQLIEYYNNKYGELDIIVFGPSEEARQYLQLHLHRDMKLKKINSTISECSSIFYRQLYKSELQVTKYAGITISKSHVYSYCIIYNKDTLLPIKDVPHDIIDEIDALNLMDQLCLE